MIVEAGSKSTHVLVARNVRRQRCARHDVSATPSWICVKQKRAGQSPLSSHKQPSLAAGATSRMCHKRKSARYRRRSEDGGEKEPATSDTAACRPPALR